MTMTAHVFTYGSLMFAEVWQRVVRGDYRFVSAVLDGHARYEIAGETYPGMVPQAGAAVRGVLYFDVAPEDMAALDAFEGSEYRRETVNVRQEQGGMLSADTYLYLPRHKLSPAAWEPERFQMQRFIGSYVRERLGD
jgi:gamma-glutamylcyclotransferase (GGCT)/AIG2-like uncharacterized protein YtfP